MATPAKSKWQTKWDRCCLCQVETNEDLKAPPTAYEAEHDGYKNIAANIPVFHSLNCLPISLDPGRLDEGDGIENTLRRNKAKYHQSCRRLFNNTKLKRAKKRASLEPPEMEEPPNKLSRTVKSKSSHCFICDLDAPEHDLRRAMTMQLNEKVNQCARTLSDGKLLAKLSAGDVVAQGLMYHPACLAALYNRERAHMNTIQTETSDDDPFNNQVHAIAFSELVTYINETKVTADDNNPPTFRLADLVALYNERVMQLDITSSNVHPTRLKTQLLSHIPELEAYKDGRDVLLAYRNDIAAAFSQANVYTDALLLAKAAEILRKEMLKYKSRFDHSLCNRAYEDCIPPTLLQFVGMLGHGADIKSQIRHGLSKPDIAIANLLQFNCHAGYKAGTPNHRHSRDRETPFPIYIGLHVFSKTRKRQLVDVLFEHGISISYDRVLEISTELGQAVVAQYVKDGLVCPPSLRRQLFTTSAIDNIDHNPSATSAHTSFHGTSISVLQHPRSGNPGEVRIVNAPASRAKQIPELPCSYTNVKPAHFNDKHPNPPPCPVIELPVA